MLNQFVVRWSIAACLVAGSPAFGHDEDDAHDHGHHGVVVQARDFEHATRLVRSGLKRLGAAVESGDLHALHELSDGVVVPARSMGRLAALANGPAKVNVKAIHSLGKDLATLVDAMHVAADQGKVDIVTAKWKEVEALIPLLDQLAPAAADPVLEVRPAIGVPAGAPAALTLTLKDGTGGGITEPISEHGRHFFIVSKGLGWYSHEVRSQNADGSFGLSPVFPAAGDYVIYSELELGNDAPRVLRAQVTVDGTGRLRGDELKPESVWSKEVDGYAIGLKGADHIHAGEAVVLTVEIQSAGAPGAVSTEPYAGLPGHFTAISADLDSLVVGRPEKPVRPGVLTFLAAFPEAGVYKSWIEFMHNGRVIAAPFVVEVHGEH